MDDAKSSFVDKTLMIFFRNLQRPENDLFEWIQDEYWYQWLDEVYPPSTEVHDIVRGSLPCWLCLTIILVADSFINH